MERYNQDGVMPAQLVASSYEQDRIAHDLFYADQEEFLRGIKKRACSSVPLLQVLAGECDPLNFMVSPRRRETIKCW